MMQLPRLPLDINVPPGVLSRRGGVTISEHIIRTFLERRTAEITVDSAQQNAVFVRISEDAALASSGTSPSLMAATSHRGSSASPVSSATSASRRLSEADRLLLEVLDTGRCRSRHTGRFLTMHKRRRKRLTTRSLNQDPGILDDILHGQVQCVLQNAGNWRFNAFTLETVTGGRSLPVLCVHLFYWYGLLQHFKLDVVRVWKLFSLIEEGYHSTNPYHNSIHATDVTQAMHCFLQEEKIKRNLSPLEIMGSLIGAVTHDLDHPGVNQPFLVATSNHLAALYENTSVLENHHWRSAIGCLLESGVSEQLAPEMRPELESHISSLILATDITRQQEFLTKFKVYLDDNLLEMRHAEHRHFILQIALKCADISNPCRPWDISRKWSHKVCEEFFRQGDYERQLNLPVTPLCDRHATSIPKIQAGFFKFVVTPLYEEWHRFLRTGLSINLMDHLKVNQTRWEALIQQETGEDAKTPIPEAEESHDGASSGDEEQAEDSGSIDLFLPNECISRRPSLPERSGAELSGRRHSVPISVCKTLGVPRMTIRRESLPTEQKKLRNPIVRLEDQSFLERSSLSLLSSRSSIHESSATGSAERPVSAENLLPEPSIASITNSAEATRLSTVLQPDQKQASQTKQLTRQQTFPPLQPYSRMRYMSTTAEMSQCSEVLVEGDSSGSSTPSPARDKSCYGGQCGTPPDSPPRKIASSLAIIQSQRKESDYTDSSSRKRGSVVSELRKPEMTLSPEHARRHSMQLADSPIQSKHSHRHRRASAQEPDSTQRFYASLTGGQKLRGSAGVLLEAQPDSRLESMPCRRSSRSELKTESSLSTPLISPGSKKTQGPSVVRSTDVKTASSSSVSPSVIASKDLNQNSQLPAIPDDTTDRNVSSPIQECCSMETPSKCDSSRRYSTPVTNSARTDSTARRYSAAPSSSDGMHKVFFIGTPPDSPPRGLGSSSESGSEPRKSISDSSSDSVSVGSKRDSDSPRDKGPKIPKLSVELEMKENVDPRTGEDGKVSSLPRRCSQGWARRRGSAPVGLLSKLDDVATTPMAPRGDRYSRRGSVPTDITRHQNGGSHRSALGPRGENLPLPRRASLPQETALGNLLASVFLLPGEQENCPNNNNVAARVIDALLPASGMPSPRRGSVPADISELRRDMFNRNSVNGKSRNRKKILRRRSSGGPEMFAGGTDANDNSPWLRWKRDLVKRDSIPEPLVRRRGSLPIEMVAVSHAGSAAGPRKSSLWRL